MMTLRVPAFRLSMSCLLSGLAAVFALGALPGVASAAKPAVPAELLGKWGGEPPAGSTGAVIPVTVEFRSDATEIVTESGLDVKAAKFVRETTYSFTVLGNTVDAVQTGSRLNGKNVPLTDAEKTVHVVFQYQVVGDTLTAHGDNTKTWTMKRLLP